MLTIPDTIKALYKKESVRKNYRIVFPNGEHNDIINTNLVQESVRFTESICSRETFRFGLAENSVLEFETVGISDMRGMLIQAFVEVDTSSLSSSEISAIISTPGDGKIVRASASTIGYGYYQIPLGTFIVASCPRDQAKLAHRKVTAYSRDFFGTPSPAELTKLQYPIYEKKLAYAPQIVPLVHSQLCWDSDALLLAEGYTRASVALGSISRNFTGVVVSVYNTNGQKLNLNFTSVSYKHVEPYFDDAGRTLTGIYYDKSDVRGLWKDWEDYLDTLNIDYSRGATVGGIQTIAVDDASDVRELLAQQVYHFDGTDISSEWTARYWYNTLTPYFECHKDNDASQCASCTLLDVNKGTQSYLCWYPFGFQDGNGNFLQQPAIHAWFPTSAKLSVNNETAGTTTTKTITRTNLARVGYFYTPPSGYPLQGYRLAFSATGDDVGVSNFIGCYDIHKILSDYLELIGKFAAPSRINSVDIFHLSDANSVAYAAGDYRSFWWDEYAGQKAGIIRYVVKVGDEDTVVDYQFGAGTAIYDMSDNTIFRNCGITKNDAAAFLQANLVPYLEDLVLDTVEMECRGFPWVEPRDFLQITTAAANSFGVYLTRREMRGIQILVDQADAIGNGAGTGSDVNHAQATVTAQALSPDIVITAETSAPVASIAANTNQAIALEVFKAGYLPIGIVGLQFNGSGQSLFNTYRFRIKEDQKTAEVAFRNGNSSTVSNISATFYILWKRT